MLPVAGVAGVLSLSASVLAFVGQVSETPVSAPAFEIVSVKPSRIPNLDISWDGRTFVAIGASVERLASFAYEVPPFQIVGGPDWTRTERFEIRARAPEVDSTHAMGDVQGRRRVVAFVRTLLADRFALRIREETRTAPVFRLRQRDKKNLRPPGMRPSDPACEHIRSARPGEPPQASAANSPETSCGMMFRLSSAGWMTVSARSTTMSELTDILKGYLGRPIDDQSGINGNFALELTVGLDQSPALAPLSVDATPTSGQTIADALAEQLNLSLRSATGPVRFFVIENLDRPTPD